MSQIELLNQLLYLTPVNTAQINDEYKIKLSGLDSNTWNHSSVCK